MSTQRIKVSSDSAFESVVGYSRAVRIGPHVVVAGTTGDGDDIAAQTRDALHRIAIALREAGANLTDHFNPVSAHTNVADPQYGVFFGQYRRRFTADFDVIF